MQTPPWYVLTGGPCAGKTTTIEELAKRGYPVLAEAARLIIEEKLAAGLSLEQIVADPDWMPSVARRKYAMEKAMPADMAYFFDRGIPDSVAYYRLVHLPIDEMLRAMMDEIRYRKVFLLDLVDFKNDVARHETPEQAMIIHGMIREAYADQGYEIVEVPIMPLGERVDFILAQV